MAAKTRKVGRPKLPKSESRIVVSLRLKPAELKEFENCAKREGASLSNWIRDLLNRAAEDC